ncbi:MAG: carboxypeptidase-like regulatory domain-containing protein [Candidatus Sulfotelmatobacter sp.]
MPLVEVAPFISAWRKNAGWLVAGTVLILLADWRNGRAEDPAKLTPVEQKELDEFKSLISSQVRQPRVTTDGQHTQVATAGKMRIRVIDPDGNPVAAKIHASVWTSEEKFKHNRDYVCNEAGESEIELPKQLEILRVWARHDGLVPMYTQWWPDMEADGDQIPEQFTFKLPKGTVIGGTVKDEAGKPIAGVNVEASLDSKGHEIVPKQKNVLRPKVDMWLAEGDDAAVTDANGKWTLGNVPAGDDVKVRVTATHPDYISLASISGLSGATVVPIQDLRAQTVVIEMQQGVRVTGRIRDPDGKPIGDAVVIWGDDPYFEHRPQQEVLTDADGLYRLPPLPMGPVRVTVVAQGWMPELRIVNIEGGMKDENFELHAGKKLRIRFVDSQGTPVPNVGVTIGGWQEVKSLYNYKHTNVIDTKIPRQADKNGVYQWNWAPADAVLYSFGAGKLYVSDVALTADDEGREQTIDLGDVKQEAK